MKDSSKQDSFYLLSLKENYLEDITFNERDLVNDWQSIILEYLSYAQESVNKISLNNKNLSKFLLIRGIDTIHRVFSTLLFFTFNPSLVLYHCQRSFYFYIEFVTQIKQDDKSFLQLNSKDAVLYVYKKTIFEIDFDVKCNRIISTSNKKKLKKIELAIEIMKCALFKIINNFDLPSELPTLLKPYNNIICIILYGNKSLYDKHLDIIYSIIEVLVSKISNINVMIETIILFLKTSNNNIELFNISDKDCIINDLLDNL